MNLQGVAERALSIAVAGAIGVSVLGAGVPVTWAGTLTKTYSETDRVPAAQRQTPPGSRSLAVLGSTAVPSKEASVTPSPAEQPVQLVGKTALREKQRRYLEQLAVRMQNNSLRYLHTSWWRGTYTYKQAVVTQPSDSATGAPITTTVEVLVPPGGFGAGEVPIRRQASALYATAIALSDGSYDAARVGVSRAEALRRTVAWTNALAISYKNDGWSRWQSGLWVYYLGMGARQIWSSLPTCTQDLVRQAVTSEANYHLSVPPGYYRDSKGRIVSAGYSKGPDDAWNADLLYLAAREFPDDPNSARWEGQARWYSLVAYATPSQVGTDPRITGSNANSDGTVTNHHIIHPDYMLGEAEAIIKYKLVAAHTGTAVAPEGLNNRLTIWRGLTRHWFSTSTYRRPGGTIYRSDRNGHAIADIYYPQGTDWSYSRKFNAAVMDIVNFTDNVDSKASSWARQHLLFTLRQQARYSDGRIFSSGETQFAEEEQFAAASAAESVQLLILARYGPFMVETSHHGTQAVMRRNAQLWNGTAGTKRKPSPRKGGIVKVTGPIIVRKGHKYIPVSWGGNPKGGWVRYDYIKWF